MNESGKNNKADASLASAAVEAWVTAGKREVLDIAGASMRPMLGDGTRALVQFGVRDFRVGDIAVFRLGDTVTIHRIVRITYRHGDAMLHTKGDCSFNFDPGPLNERDALGKVVGIMREGRIVNVDSGFMWNAGRVIAFFSLLFGSAVDGFKRILGIGKAGGREDSRRGR